jgi:hypothetical protein
VAAAVGQGEALRLAVFVSPHGFGHAARAAALLAALREQRRELDVTLYTTVPVGSSSSLFLFRLPTASWLAMSVWCRRARSRRTCLKRYGVSTTSGQRRKAFI